MLRALMLGGLASAMVVGAASAAEFDDFQSICIKTNGDASAALAAADGAGWMPLPQAVLDQIKPQAKGMGKTEGRLRSGGSGLSVVVVNNEPGLFGGSTEKLAVCAFWVLPANAELASHLTSWAGVPEEPAMSGNGMHGYLFEMNPGGHRQLDPRGLDATSGKAKVAFVLSTERETMVAFGQPVNESH